MSWEATVAVIVATAVLHNHANEQRVPLSKQGDEDEGIDEVPAEYNQDVGRQMAGNVTRQHYIRGYCCNVMHLNNVNSSLTNKSCKCVCKMYHILYFCFITPTQLT